MRKNNLSYYSHEVDSHHHWKFKLLRKKFGWEGEGKFWALNNLIAKSDMCLLDIGENGKQEQLAADLDFEKEEFLLFLEYLEDKCKLVKKINGRYATTSTQEDLDRVNKTREQDRQRKNK